MTLLSRAPSRSFSRASLRRVLVGASVSTALVLSACGGSTLDPADVARANGLVNGAPGAGTGQVGTVDPVTGDPVVDPGTGEPVTDPGSNPADPAAGGSADPGTGGTGGTGGGGARPATGGGRAASCEGFKNTTGITDSTITIGNITDISGPVPGILTANRDAVKAYVKYFNSTGAKICGRSLEVKSYDSQTNTSGDAVATQKACDETFASVGSMSAFDTGGLSIAKQCGIPGIHSIITNQAREQTCPNCFAAAAGTAGGGSPHVIPDYFTKINKAGTQKAAYLAVAVAASVDGMKRTVASSTKRGWKFVYTATFDIAEFNYGPYVQRLKAEGARIVYFLGSSDMAVRMLRAFKSANYKPDQFLMTATSYDKIFTDAGPDVNGSIVFADFTPLEEASKNAELRLYLQWLQQVAPGARPTYFGEYAWSATRLFVEQAIALGGKLSRPALVASLKKVRGWSGNGLHAPHDVGPKRVSACWRFLQIQNGTWKPFGPARYQCGGRS